MANENVVIIDLAIDDDIVAAEWRLVQLSVPVPSSERKDLGDVAYLALLRGLIDQYADADVIFPACFTRPDYKEDGEDLDECGICQNAMGLTEDHSAFVCGHWFHSSCIDNLFRIINYFTLLLIIYLDLPIFIT